MDGFKVLEIKQSVFADNDQRADELRSELKQKRLDLSRERQQKAFQIFSDAVLDELVLRMPISVEECAKIKGISLQKSQQLMPDFLEIIQRYRRENML